MLKQKWGENVQHTNCFVLHIVLCVKMVDLNDKFTQDGTKHVWVVLFQPLHCDAHKGQ